MTPTLELTQALRVGRWKIIPPLKRVFAGYVLEEAAVPTMKKTEAYDMNDLRKMTNNELEILILDIAKENHVYAAIGGSSINFNTDGSYTWHDRWMGHTQHSNEHEYLVHKAYALLVATVFPDIFYQELYAKS